MISIVSIKDVRLPHHKSLEEIYYRFWIFPSKKETFERQNLWILDLSCVLNYRHVYLFESQEKVIDTVYEHTIDTNLFYIRIMFLFNKFQKKMCPLHKENVLYVLLMSPYQSTCIWVISIKLGTNSITVLNSSSQYVTK